MISPDMISPVMMILKKHDDGQPACMDTSFTTRAAETTADPNYGVWNRRDDQVAPAEILKAAQDTRRFIHEKTDDCLEAHSFLSRRSERVQRGRRLPRNRRRNASLPMKRSADWNSNLNGQSVVMPVLRRTTLSTKR